MKEYTGRKERKEILILCSSCGYDFTKAEMKKHTAKKCQDFMEMDIAYNRYSG